MNVRKRAAEHDKSMTAGVGSRYINTKVFFKDEINKEIHFILKGLQVDTCKDISQHKNVSICKNCKNFRTRIGSLKAERKKNLSVKGHQSSFVINVD